MAIVINGSGTVTGLAVGGLPDGTVDAGTLATDSVVTGKIADGTIANADINASAAIDNSKLNMNWSAARRRATTNQSIPNNTATIITFASSTFDTLSEFGSDGRFTAQNTGVYKVDCHILYNDVAWANDEFAIIRVHKNGSIYETGLYAQITDTSTQQPSVSSSTLVELSVGQYVDCRAHHTQGAAVPLVGTSGNYYTYMSVHRVS